MTEDNYTKIHKDLATIAQKLEGIQETLKKQDDRIDWVRDELNRKLGELDTKYNTIEKENDKRFKELEAWKNRWVGIVVVAVGVITFVVSFFQKWLFFGGK